MQLTNYFLARPVAKLPNDIVETFATMGKAGLSEEQDEFLTTLAGLSPGFPEAFATSKVRDAALGPYGPYVEFIAASPAEVEMAGYGASDIAIGHRLGEAGFDQLAAVVLDAVVAEIAETSAELSVVIARVRYRMHIGRMPLEPLVDHACGPPRLFERLRVKGL